MLSWGFRYLMCPPEHFEVAYEINPWMRTTVVVDRDRAAEQWQGLVETLRQAGAAVEELEARPGLPDMVFTANAGMVDGRIFVPARFRHQQRQGEVAHDMAWFVDHGFSITELPPLLCHEGAGDALPFGSVLVSGYRGRSDIAAHGELSRITGAAVRSIELVDPRLYHLDLTFCPLDDRRAMVAPQAWDSYGCKVVEALVPEPLVLSDDEMLAFCANSVVVGATVVMATCPPRVGRQLEAWGFDVAEVAIGEFLKAGGGCRCLTLALDVAVGGTPAIPTAGAPPPSTGSGAAR